MITMCRHLTNKPFAKSTILTGTEGRCWAREKIERYDGSPVELDFAKYDASLSQAKREIALAQAYGVDTMLIVCGSRRPEDRRYERLSDHGVWQKVDFAWDGGELVIGADLPLGETAVRIRNWRQTKGMHP